MIRGINFHKNFFPVFVIDWTWETNTVEPSEAQLQNFIELYKKELGITITPDQAKKEIASLVFFVSLCMQPVAENN